MSTVIHWFRKGMRIHDNPALLDAIEEAIKTKSKLRPLYIIDPKLFKWLRVGANRWRCFQQHLQQLDDNLRSVGSRLYIVRGVPDQVFERIFPEWKVSLLTFEYDTESYAKIRDEKMENIAKKFNVKVIARFSHTLYHTNSVIKANGGKAPLTYQRFLTVIESMPPPKPALDPPKHIPVNLKPDLDSEEQKDKNCYDVPTIEELFSLIDLKMTESDLGECKFPGGENEALKRLDLMLAKVNWICKFEKPNTAPNSLEPSTTVLSPYLKFGSLSCRKFYHGLQAAIKGKSHSKPPVSLLGQLMWREFYYTVSVDVPNFDKMVGNPICCQVPWSNNEKHLQAWTHGQTGYPFIDAIMRQLRQEGWIHHLARHAVACFLTRGDLWISWEEGLKVFEELLLDADWALNAGNWMWLSASAFFHQFFRVYSPVAFGKKTDPNGDYIKKYVPELKKYPVAYIYEPWKAPISVQNSAGCVIGREYPRRIVVHEDVYKVNISKMSLAYKNNKSANESNKGNKKDAAASSSKMEKSDESPPSKKAKISQPKGKTQTKLSKFLKK